MPSLIERIVGATLPKLTRGVGIAQPVLTALSLQGTPLAGLSATSEVERIAKQNLPVLSANEIIRQTRAMGFGVRRTVALKAISAIKDQVKKMVIISQLPGSKIPLQSQVPMTDRRQRLKYQYTVTVMGRNSLSGDDMEQNVTINSPRLISKNRAKSIAIASILGDETYNMDDIIDSEVSIITIQNPDIPYNL